VVEQRRRYRERSGDAETKEEDGSEDELRTERKEAAPKWEVLAESKAVWVQFCKQLRPEAGGLG
jgi:hypothetical protein